MDTPAPAKSAQTYEEELKAANEIVYNHSLELARLTRELEQANAAQENLLHFMSHEIKGYLTKSEAGFAAITEGDFGTVSDALNAMAQTALVEVRKGVATIMDILDASNLKRGTVSFKKEPFDFRATLIKVADEQKKAIDEKHLALKLSIREGVCTVLGDEEKMSRHVIRNLIDNAIRYTPEGNIDVGLTCEGGTVRFTVKDSGVGITPEDMQHLFTEGGHGKDSIKINVHSTGYGLYIAKQVVDAHGGKIYAESEGEGKGARFVVEMPAA